MNFQRWKAINWRHCLILVLACVLFLSLASIPELRVLAAFMDAVGIDFFVSLLSIQLLSLLKPFAVRVVYPLLRSASIGAYRLAASLPMVDEIGQFSSRMLETGSGYLGHYTWHRLYAAWLPLSSRAQPR